MASNSEECFKSSTVDEIVVIIFNVLSIIITISIGVVTRKRLSSDAKMHLELEILFYIAIAASCTVQISSILSIVVCPSYGVSSQKAIMLFGAMNGFQGLFVAVLATLVLRLYVTFEHSAWKISRTKKIISFAFGTFMCLIWTAASVLAWNDMISRIMFYALLASGLIIFVIISVDAAYHFVSNLLALARLKASSPCNLAVNREQQRLINISAKYISLFLIAVVSSLVSTLLTAVCRLYLEIHPGTSWSIDGVANILCLYLQYTFAEKHYKRYCSRLDCCFRSKMKDNIVNAKRKSMESVATNSATLPAV